MTDDQIVAALITSYKNRGVDMSHLLTDPVFRSLPVQSQIQALQSHASELEAGISSGLNREDVGHTVAQGLSTGLKGALLGGSLGTLIAASRPGNLTPVKGALIGAGMLGGLGALMSGFHTEGRVRDRREVKNALKGLSEASSPVPSVTLLSGAHAQQESKNLKQEILNRIAGDLHQSAQGVLPGYFETLHG